MEYYYCKMLCFQLCEECSKWVDGAETTIEKQLNAFKPVVHPKIRKNNKKNKHQIIIIFISMFIIE